MQRLTITIPTYNRSEALSKTVRQLLPQLTQECNLVIVDNASETPAIVVLGELLLAWPDVNIQIHRNRYNVGMCGNFMRCFELCDTEWLWILGDDEIPCPDAIKKIFRQLNSHPDCIFHNFVSPTLRRENRIAMRDIATESVGSADFIRKLDHFSSIQYISLNIYKTLCFVKHFSIGVNYSYSLHNFVAMILSGLEKDGKACFSPEVLIPNHGIVQKAWSRIDLALVSCTILEMPFEKDVRICLEKKIRATFFRLNTTVTILLDDIKNKRRSADEVRYIFHQICARAYYNASFTAHVKIAIYRFIFLLPFFSNILRKTPLIKKILFNEKQ
jgi:glycosyltransferase involved in cell wall biosynthesis